MARIAGAADGGGMLAGSLAGRHAGGLALVAALYALIVRQYGHGHVLAETDMAWMAAGVVHGTVAGEPFSGALHYGIGFSYGYYALLYGLLPEAVRADPAALAQAMNRIGALGIVAALPLTWLYLACIAGAAVAWIATALFFFSPGALHAATSGHPLLPAFALAMAAALLLLRAGGGARGVACIAGALAIMTAALSLRAEVALLFPWLVLAAPGGQPPGGEAWRRGALVRGAVLAAALLLFFLLQQAVVPAPQRGATSILAALASYFRPAGLAKGAAVAILALGFGTCLVLALLALIAARRGAGLGWRALLAAALVAPGLVWLPFPQPVRHYFVLGLGASLAFAWLAQAARLPPARAAGLAAAVILGNQLLAEAAHPLLVRLHDWSYPAGEARRSVFWAPLGAVWLDAPARRRRQELLFEEARRLADEQRDAARLLIFAEEDRYIVARLVAQDPALRPSVTQRKGVSFQELRSDRREILIARFWHPRPREAAMALLARGHFGGWTVYGQPSTVGALPDSVGAGLARPEAP